MINIVVEYEYDFLQQWVSCDDNVHEFRNQSYELL